MPSERSSVFSRVLSSEERAWVRDLGNHPGYQLFLQGVQELMAQQLNLLLEASDLKETFHSQGRFMALREVLSIPEKLASPPARPNKEVPE